MKDVLDAVTTRIKAPYFGYAVLAFIGWNWRGLFLLVMTPGTPEHRLTLFDTHTNMWSLYAAPLLTGLFVAASAEWISFILSWISRKPVHWKETEQLESEHRKNILIADLEKIRNERFSRKEEELIARAKRDEQVKEIVDDDLKKELADEIEALRNEQQIAEREEFEAATSSALPSHFARELLTQAADFDGRIIKKSDGYGKRIRAGQLEIAKGDHLRKYSRYETALRELIDRNFVNEEYEGIYEITEDGWQFLDFDKSEITF